MQLCFTAGSLKMSDLPPPLKKIPKDGPSVKLIGAIKRPEMSKAAFINPKNSKF